MVEQHAHYPETSTDQIMEQLERPGPTVLALEGGPLGGKTTIANMLVAEATAQGREAIILPEVATELGTKLLERGLSIPYLAEHDRPGYLAFQKDLIAQIAANITAAKERYAGTNALIIADRSDNAAYMSRQEYDEVLTDVGLSAPPHTTLVDTMIYLPTLAHDDSDQYEALLQTNATRYESPADAIATCVRNMDTVSMHPDLRVYWGADFAQKTTQVLHDVLDNAPQSKARVIANGTSLDMLRAILETVDATALEASAIHRTSHQRFDLEHRITEAGNHLYYYFSHVKNAAERRTLTLDEFEILSREEQLNSDAYICQPYMISSNNYRTIATVKQHNDGHWTLEVQ
jgi:hypothetical protein